MKRAILLILLLPILASAQYFDVFDIDTSDYPMMKAKFYSIDANGNQILNHTPADFEITENGEPRDVISVSCPDPLPRPISVGIMVDTYSYIEIARNGSETLVKYLNMPLNEVSITYMDRRPLVYQDFTNDKTKALKKSKTIPPAPGYTQVERMFFDSYAGGINLIKTREAQNRVLVYISDLHCPNLSLNEQKLFQEAIDNNIRIYTILINTTDYSGLFSRITDQTHGLLFENVGSNIIENIFEKIAYREQNDPCDISWYGEIGCEKIKEFIIREKVIGKYKEIAISLGDKYKATLHIDPYLINMGLVNKSEYKDTSITLTAKNIDQVISSIQFEPDNGNFEVLTQLPLVILKEESLDLIIRYNAIDTSRQYTKLILTTNYCNFNLGLLAGSKYGPISIRTLELTRPNGGEVFSAGSDTTITWEGISDQEEVSVKFSSDNGKKWIYISEAATNLKENWNIPNIQSDSCLISIEQYEENNNSNNEEGQLLWQKSFGGYGTDEATSIAQTFDGGFIVAGRSSSTNGDITTYKGNFDYWILRLKKDGELEWQKSFGGSNQDIATSITQTLDGGYIVGGYSESINGDISNPKGGVDYWVVKMRVNGELEWQKSYGGKDFDAAQSIVQTLDGGYIIVGQSSSNDGDKSDSKGSKDYWIIKLEEDGDLSWQKSFGGSSIDASYSVQQTSDGGFIITGRSNSYDGDITSSRGPLNYDYDYWILKLEEDGDLEWEKSFGGSGDDRATSIIQTFDGGYIIAGYNGSLDGDKTEPKGHNDYWIVKLEEDGDLEWEKSFGGVGDDRATSIVQTFDGGYIVAGFSKSRFDDIIKTEPDTDLWIVKLEQDGELEWQKSFGGTGDDAANSIKQTLDGGYIVAGFSKSTDGDVTNNKGDSDFWVLKISAPPQPLQSDTSDAVFSIIMPEPVIQNNDIDMGQMIVGSTKDTIVSSVICNIGDAPLHVLGVDITGGNASDFLIPRGAGDFYLKKGECQDMMFEFTPYTLGNRAAFATIRTTSGDFKDTIHIRGVGINPVIEPKTEVVDFGKIKLGLSKDTTVIILENKSNQDINITDSRIIGPDMDQFEILSTNKSFIVPANGTKDLRLRFLAQFTGRTSSLIEFEYDGAITPLRSMLFAEGISDVVQTISDTVNFGDIKIGSLKDTNAYIIRNISRDQIDITDMKITGPEMNQFSIQESGTDFSIDSYDSLQVQLRFTASNPGVSMTTLQSYNYLTSTTLETVLLGKGVGGIIKPSMKDAFIGENSNLELHLDGINPSLLLNIATNYSATVSYNSTLLAPIDKSMLVTTEDNKSYIKINGNLSGVSQIAAIPMKVGLGTDDRSGLVITEFQLYDANGDSVDYDIEPGVGEFNVLGKCEEGGKRLINPNGEVILQVIPENQFGNARVSLTLIETGRTELEIYDQIGNKIETIYSGTPSAGSQEINLDLSNYANGRYYIRLTTPTITKTEIIEVVR